MFHRRPSSLNEVFGITSSIPQYTYVDRSNLDQQFKYFVNNEKHIVIHGSSKQGKTVLRRKNLPENSYVVAQCRANSSLEQLYTEILRKLGVAVPVSFSKGKTLDVEGQGGLPNVAEIAGSWESNLSTNYKSVGTGSDSLGYISEEIKKKNKRVIIEDFHYLSEEEKRSFAFDLKALWDNSVFLIIVGVWAEDNLLLYYNGDLSGRVNEIDIRWTDDELEQVLLKGEKTLNINFSDQVRRAVIRDSSQNIGLLQRITEKLCFASGIVGYQTRRKVINNINALANCRKKICEEQSSRYRQFIEGISYGFRSNGSTSVYQQIIRACIDDCSDSELCGGIHRDFLYEKIKKFDPNLPGRNLTNALRRLNKLQLDKHISPLVFSYNPNLKKVQLVDRELLFYRRYGNPSWPWKE